MQERRADQDDSVTEPVWYERIALQDNGVWRRRYTFPLRNGTRYKTSLGTRDRDEAARIVRDEWTVLEHKARQAALLKAGVITPEQAKPREDMTLKAACEKYMTEHGDRLPSRQNIAGYHKVLQAELGAETLLSAIDTAMVATLVRRLEKETIRYRDGDRPMAEGTINHHVRHLRALMRRARRQWRMNCDYEAIIWSGKDGNGVLLPEPDFERTTITDPDAERKVMEAMAEDTRPVFEFALEIGVRAANAYTLRWSQVAWDDEVMTAGTVTFAVKSKKRDRRTGKSGKQKAYPITERMAEILRAAWQQNPDPDGHVFTFVCRRNRNWLDRQTGERHRQKVGGRYPFTKSLLRDRWEAARDAADMPHLRWHDATRATFATRLHEDGVDLVDIKEAMGHADIETTLRYIDVKGERTRTIIEAAAQRRAARMAASKQRPKRKEGKLKLVK